MKRILIAIAFAGAGLADPLGAVPTASAAPPAVATTTAKPRVKSGARLDEVHIKGEIPEPQVLFVVGRERRRFLDFQHRRYLDARSNAGPVAPAWVRVVDTGGPHEDR